MKRSALQFHVEQVIPKNVIFFVFFSGRVLTFQKIIWYQT
jgi:hypothetical protein